MAPLASSFNLPGPAGLSTSAGEAAPAGSGAHSEAAEGPERLYVSSAPSAAMVEAAVGLFEGHRVADRRLGVTLLGDPNRHTEVVGAAFRKGQSLGFNMGPASATRDHELVEGPRFRVFVGPGVVEARRNDYARRERSAERLAAAGIAAGIAGQVGKERSKTRGSVAAWSSKSRANMTRVAHGLDWSAWDELPGTPALVTLTAASRWLAQFPRAESGSRAISVLLKRFYRDFGYRPAGLWKREFQDRAANCVSCRRRRMGNVGGPEHPDDAEHPDSGRAPHWHLLVRLPPLDVTDSKTGLTFREWLAREWVDITCSGTDLTEDERHAMYLVHVHHKTIAAPKGKWTVSGIVSYFSKHGAFEAKSYQNIPPAEWVDAGSVGRYWGRWGITRQVAGVEVPPEQFDVIKRTMRRWSRANGVLVDVPMWRYRTLVDHDTGEVTALWRKSRKRRRSYQVKGAAGYLVVRDGPAFASQLARAADRATRGDGVLSGPAPGALAAVDSYPVGVSFAERDRRAAEAAKARAAAESSRPSPGTP